MIDSGDKTATSRGAQRDSAGRFLPGNDTEFKPGDINNPKGRSKDRPLYGTLCAEVTRQKASKFKWVTDLCKKLDLDPAKVTVGEVLVHADLRNRVEGKVGYLVEQNQRSEGKVPDQVVTFNSEEMVKVVRGIDLDVVLGRENDEQAE
jgi:hypothetical protein